MQNDVTDDRLADYFREGIEPSDVPAIFALQRARGAINSLAFGPDPGRGPDGTSRWRLASGDAGSEVTIWDVTTCHPVASCRGSLYEVTALAFSPGAGLSDGRTDHVAGPLLLRPPVHVGLQRDPEAGVS